MRIAATLTSLLLVLLLIAGRTGAQDDADRVTTLDADEVVILNDVNLLRLLERYPHLVPNPDLIALAHRHLDDLLARGSFLGDVYRSSEDGPNGEPLNIEGLLARENYPPYPAADGTLTRYVADFAPFRLLGVAPEAFVEAWNLDSQQAAPELLSRSMSLGVTGNPIYRPEYREIGIAYASDGASPNERHYYVLVLASQPNVIPFVIYGRTNPEVILETVEQRSVFLRINDERAALRGVTGPEPIMGRVEFIRVSEDGATLDCPPDPDDPGFAAALADGGWRDFDADLDYTLSAGSGVKTVYVQLCDEDGRTVLSSRQITLIDPDAPTSTPTSAVTATPPPDPLALAEATQTQAAIQTQNAPVLPTVEAILTGTAAAATPAP